MPNRSKLIIIVLGLMLIGVLASGTWQSHATSSNSESEAGPILQNITPKDAHALIQKHEKDDDFIILDVRTPGEFKQAHLKDAKMIDYYSETFRDELQKLDKDQIYLIYCRSGNRSGRTLRIMKELKFTHVYNMLGGIGGWYQEGLPLTK
jgi:rhodanese-related sulfurtransferase